MATSFVTAPNAGRTTTARTRTPGALGTAGGFDTLPYGDGTFGGDTTTTLITIAATAAPTTQRNTTAMATPRTLTAPAVTRTLTAP